MATFPRQAINSSQKQTKRLKSQIKRQKLGFTWKNTKQFWRKQMED